MAKHFIVGAGGTGMRQLESFVHLCAAGVFPGDEFHLLSIDTDVTNGNRSKLIRLTELYEKIKGVDIPSDSGLFSAKIKSYHFAAMYEGKSAISIEQIIQQLNIDNEDNIELSKLLLSENTRSFSLEHGYKAQTQLGSLHMFASILNSMHKFLHGTTVEKSKNKIIHDYLNEMTEDSQLFVVGSVFGGTGASSVPIIPKAFKAAYKYISLTNSLPIANENISCAILTDYFKFNSENAKIIAKAKQFRMNSKIALDFYKKNLNKVYDKIFILGANDTDVIDFEKDGTKKNATGGDEQNNPSNILELISVASLYSIKNNIPNGLYSKTTTINDDNIIDFNTIIDGCLQLEVGFSALFAAGIVSEKTNGLKEYASNNKVDFNVDNESYENLDEYLKLFIKYYLQISDTDNIVGENKVNLLNKESLNEKHIGIVNLKKDFRYDKGLFGKNNKAFNDLTEKYENINKVDYKQATEENKLINSLYDAYNSLTNRQLQ